jgi:hypothetical protein
MRLHVIDGFGWLKGILKKHDAEVFYYELQSH